jgi:O-antigen ligase
MAFIAFQAAGRTVVPLISYREFQTWRNAWFASTAAAFLLGNFFAFVLALSFICWCARGRTSNLCLYVILVFTAPPEAVTIDGFGIVNQLLQLNHAHILAVLLLIPVILSPKRLTSTGENERYILLSSNVTLAMRGRRRTVLRGSDFLIVCYVLLRTILEFRDASFTHVLRTGVIHTLDILLPYFAFTRGVQSVDDIRKVLLAFVTATMPLAIVGVFEMVKGWLVYPIVLSSWGIPLQITYVQREGMLRAAASATQPIVFGFILMVAVGCLLAVWRQIGNRLSAYASLGVLAAGLASSLSRGPWLGTAVIFAVVILTSRKKASSMLKVFALALCLSPLLMTSAGEKVLHFLPFIGSVETENIDYRERLLDNSIRVIERNLLFGSENYLSTPEMQEMMQGQGIIDVVNTYLQVALTSGVAGLVLFVSPLALILYRLLQSLKTRSDIGVDSGAILGTFASILITITTVSSISFIPYSYWMFAGLSIGMLRIIKNSQEPSKVAQPAQSDIRNTASGEFVQSEA